MATKKKRAAPKRTAAKKKAAPNFVNSYIDWIKCKEEVNLEIPIPFLLRFTTACARLFFPFLILTASASVRGSIYPGEFLVLSGVALSMLAFSYVVGLRKKNGRYMLFIIDSVWTLLSLVDLFASFNYGIGGGGIIGRYLVFAVYYYLFRGTVKQYFNQFEDS